MKSRAATFDAIQDRQFDLCIIGGGATGLGCALDAQLRGLRTILVDGGDFVSQTSSASTKLVHGGVRYLQQAVKDFDYGQFQMVRKALHERIHMLHAAPYLARPLQLLVPCYSQWQRLYFAIGMKAYDLVAGEAHLSPSRALSPREAHLALPTLRMDRVAGAVTYADGQFDDARYGIALAETASQRGCEFLNYAHVTGFTHDSAGKLEAAHVHDVIGDRDFQICARSFLNCTGPFADAVRLLANPAMQPRLRISKGIHILLPLSILRSETALLIPETEDGRVIFAIPWFGSLLVGTTEDEIEHGDDIAATEAEIAYLLKYINHYLDVHVTQADVQAAFSGVRPLVASAHSADTKKLVRDHEVELDTASGLISVLGGKWTTYRAMAEDAINHVERALNRAASPSTTRNMLLTGAENYHEGYRQLLASRYCLAEPVAQHLAQKFGTNADKVLELAMADPELMKPLYPDAEVLALEVVYCVRYEMAQTIEDLLARRTGIQFHSWQNAVCAAPAVGQLIARELGLSKESTEAAVDAYIRDVQTKASKAGISVPEKNVQLAGEIQLR